MAKLVTIYRNNIEEKYDLIKDTDPLYLPQEYAEYPTLFSIGELVLFNPDVNVYIPAVITEVKFTVPKVKYNIKAINGFESEVYSQRVVEFNIDKVSSNYTFIEIEDFVYFVRRGLREF